MHVICILEYAVYIYEFAIVSIYVRIGAQARKLSVLYSSLAQACPFNFLCRLYNSHSFAPWAKQMSATCFSTSDIDEVVYLLRSCRLHLRLIIWCSIWTSGFPFVDTAAVWDLNPASNYIRTASHINKRLFINSQMVWRRASNTILSNCIRPRVYIKVLVIREIVTNNVPIIVL